LQHRGGIGETDPVELLERVNGGWERLHLARFLPR
jgi:hypothetical protein